MNWRRQDGQAMVMAAIWILLVGIVTFTLAVSFGSLSLSTDWISHVAQQAAKGGGTAGMEAQTVAVGNPQFNVPVVQQVATQIMASNLGLDPSSLVPQPGSPFVNTPQIQVVVTNGPFPAVMTIPFTGGQTITENYPTVIVAIQGDVQNWMGHTVQANYWAAARIYEPGAPP